MNIRSIVGVGACLLLGEPIDGWAQSAPPKIERQKAEPQVPDIGLMPGVPMAPHNPDPSLSMAGVIDSGVQIEHPQIGDIVGPTRDFTGEGFFDHSGHGTTVVLIFMRNSSSSAAQLKQLDEALPGPDDRRARIAVAKVVGRQPAEPQVIADRIAAAVDWIGTLNVVVVNISMALPAGSANFDALCAAIERQSKILFIVAAGNRGPDATVFPASCPIPNVMAVGAMGADGTVPEYSGRADIVSPLPPVLQSRAIFFLNLGNEQAQAGAVEAAKKSYEAALNADPSPQARGGIEYGLGFLALKGGDGDGALEHFRSAAELDPDFAESFVALSNILTRRQHFEEALLWIEKGRSLHPENPRLLDRHIRVLLDLARPVEALEAIGQLEQINPETQDLESLKIAAQNYANVLNAVETGIDPAVLLFDFAQGGDARLIRFLFKRYTIDPDRIPAGRRVAPLVAAASGGHMLAMRELLDEGADVNITDVEYKLTAMMTAANAGHLDAVEFLLNNGASIDEIDYFGFTPLLFAAEQGHVEVVRLLLKAGADLSPRSEEDTDALGYAKRYGHAEIVSLIEGEFARRLEK